MKSTLLILSCCAAILIHVTSCEGYSSASGTVKDETTDLPLDSVLSRVTTGSMQVYTDAAGKFSVHNAIGGCSGGCSEITVEFSKKNYKTITATEEKASGIIFLEKK